MEIGTMNAAQLINQDSGIQEYYTPKIIVEAAWRTMGAIDLDPASSAVANQWVNANRYFTAVEDGLSQSWEGRIWLNHPFGRKENPQWINKLMREWDCGNIEQACCITFAATSEKWFQPLMAHPQCYLSPRTNYYLANGTKKRGVTKGSVVTYLGPMNKWLVFKSYFDSMGSIKVTL